MGEYNKSDGDLVDRSIDNNRPYKASQNHKSSTLTIT